MTKKKNHIAAKVKEIISFNCILINSDSFKELYEELNNFLVKEKLKEPYNKLLQELSQLPPDVFYTYKNKSVIEVDKKIFKDFYDSSIKNQISTGQIKDIKIYLINVGLLNEISYDTLANEYLGSNNLDYLRLKPKKIKQDTYLIIEKLDEQLLNRLSREVEIKNKDISKIENTKDNDEIIEKEVIRNSIQNNLQTKEGFYETLSFLNEEVKKLKKLDKNNKFYRFFNDTELIYTYSLLVSQCRLHKEVDLSLTVGRPAFLWRHDHLKVKFKRMHPLKNESFYIERIDDLVKLGLIERVRFELIDTKLLKFIDEKEKKKEPILYVFPHIDAKMLIDIKLDDSSLINRITSLKNSIGEIDRNFSDEKNAIAIKEEEFSFSNLPSVIEHEKTLADIGSERQNYIKWDNKWKDNFRERINYNLNKIKSEFFVEIYKPIDEYLVNNHLKNFYVEILRRIMEPKNNYFIESKNKSIFYIDEETLKYIYKDVFFPLINEEEPQVLFCTLIEIGLFEKISIQNIASELGLTLKELEDDIRNIFPNKYINGEDLYVLLRLNEGVLKGIYNNIKEKYTYNPLEDEKESNNELKKVEKSNSEDTKNLPAIDYSITESALDILIESEIEGNKVIINKYYFDKLIKAILGEVPDI
ncbi:hypothetical protein ACSFXN_03690 [Planococcus sp. 1R117A]|uniref:hypothetical protein n=1 Tax=Planococcus sp. 1R117A TaxID=3447020 RepID=UPI003EDBC381